MTIRVNGGIISGQSLTGSIRYFNLTGPFAWTISDGSVNLPVSTRGGNPPTTTYFQVGNGSPVPNSAAEIALRTIQTQASIVQIATIESTSGNYGTTTNVQIACSDTAFGWGSNTTDDMAAVQIQAAISALGQITVYISTGSNNPANTPVVATVDMSTIVVTEVPFILQYSGTSGGSGLPAPYSFSVDPVTGDLVLKNGTSIVSQQNIDGSRFSSSVWTSTGSFHLGQMHSNGSAGENVVWVNNQSNIAWFPAWQGVTIDGSTVYAPTVRTLGPLLTYEPVGVVGSTPILYQDTILATTNTSYYKIDIVPAENYTGDILWRAVNPVTQIEVANFLVPNVTLQNGVRYTLTFSYPIFAKVGQTFIVTIEKGINGQLLSVMNGATVATSPYRNVYVRQFTDFNIYNAGDNFSVARGLESLSGNDRLDASAIKNLGNGGYNGFINFSTGLSQFNNAIMGSYWKANQPGTLGGITFNIGDQLICRSTISGTPSNLTDPTYWIVNPNINPIASSSVAGLVKPSTGLAVANDGTLTSNIGYGLKFDSANGNAIAVNPSAIDINSFMNADTLVMGSYKGGLTSSSTLATLSNAQRGNWWNVTSPVTISGVSFGIGDQLWCQAPVTGVPADLTDFTRVPSTTALATQSAPGTIQLAGDLSGTATSPLVGKIQGVAMPVSVPISDGQFIRTASNNTTSWSNILPHDLPLTTSSTLGGIQLTGDLGGNALSPVVIKMGGATVPSTAPTSAGQYHRSTGISTSSWSNIIASDLPTSNSTSPGIITLAGDLGGTYAVPIVSKINGISVPASPPAYSGQFIRTSSATTMTWSQILPFDLPLTTPATIGAIQLTSDLGGSATAPLVAKIQGVSISGTPAAGYVMRGTSSTAAVWSAIQSYDLPLSTSATIGAIQLTGDLGGTATIPLISKINGITVPQTAPVSSGQYMRSSSTTSTSWSNILPSDLPLTTPTILGGIQLAGDLGGTATAPLVSKIGGVSIPGSTPSASGYYFRSSGTSTTAWSTIQPSDLPQSTSTSIGGIQLTGDLGGSASSPVVSKIQGVTITGTPVTGGLITASNGTTASWVAPSTLIPLVNGAASAGSAIVPARQDHIHPRDVANAPLWVQTNSYKQYDMVLHPSDGNVYIANSDIPANTAWVLGFSGQTWMVADSAVASIWQISNPYAQGEMVVYSDGNLYISNSIIPANTAWVVGTTGATWKMINTASSTSTIDTFSATFSVLYNVSSRFIAITTGGISTGQITTSGNYVVLKANKTYLLQANLNGYSENGSAATFQAVWRTSGGTNIGAATYAATITSPGNGTTMALSTLYTPTVDTQVGVYILVSSNMNTSSIEASTVTVIQVAGVTIAGSLPTMTGATSTTNGVQGLVPAPVAGQQNYYLRGDGTWGNPTSSSSSTYTDSGSTMVYNMTANSTSSVITVGGLNFQIVTDGGNHAFLQIMRVSSNFSDSVAYGNGFFMNGSSVVMYSENTSGNISGSTYTRVTTTSAITANYQKVSGTLNLVGTSQNRLWDLNIWRDGGSGWFLKVNYNGLIW